jgi:ATP-dependent DNA ligase
MTIEKAIETNLVSERERLITLSGRCQSTIGLDLRQRFLCPLILFVPMLTKDLSIAERVQPRFIEPMYAEGVKELPDGGLWTYEPKLDGYRCLAAKRTGGVVLWSRRGNGFTSRFPEVAHACDKLPLDTLIDGEVVAIDESGQVSFNALQHSRPNAHLQFYVFDVLIHRGRNLLRLPLETRRELLETALEKVGYPVIFSRSFNAAPAELIRAARELELEGIIAKRKDSYYEPGKRNGAWVKYKINQSQEFVIGGYTPGNPFDALIVGCYDGATLKFVAKVRAGFVPHVRREVFKKLAGYLTESAHLPIYRRSGAPCGRLRQMR